MPFDRDSSDPGRSRIRYPHYLTGLRFGRLLITGPAPKVAGNGNSRFQAQCDCGATKVVVRPSLVNGRTRSCGCLMRARYRSVDAEINARTHPREFTSWRTMCAYSKRTGRAPVCTAWMDSFREFVLDVGLRPAGMVLKRRGDCGVFEPGNCVWTDKHLDRRNGRLVLTVRDVVPARQKLGAHGVPSVR